MSQGYRFTFASAFLPLFERPSNSPSREASIELLSPKAKHAPLRRAKRPMLESDDDTSDVELEIEAGWATGSSFLPQSSVSGASEPADSCPASPESSDSEIEDSYTPVAPPLPRTPTPGLGKRNVDQVHSTHTQSGPAIKKSKAAVTTTKPQDHSTKGGIMSFFPKCTKEERDEEVQRYSEKIKIKGEEEMEILEAKKRVIGDKEREGARLRKEQSRKRKRQGEIAKGERSPGGRKRTVSLIVLFDSMILMSMS